MCEVYYPNLMFEEELCGGATVSAAADKRVADLAAVMGLLALASGQPADCEVVVADGGLPDGVPSCLQHARFVTGSQFRVSGAQRFVPWGWSPAARTVAERLRFPPQGPPLSAVHQVNSRRFLEAFDITTAVEAESVTGLLEVLVAPSGDSPTSVDGPASVTPRADSSEGSARPPSSGRDSQTFGTVCGSLHETASVVEKLCRQFGEEWVIKSEFSQAARNRIRGRGIRLSEPHQSWLRKRFERSEIVVVEPWVKRVAECGLQFEILSCDGTSEADDRPQIRTASSPAVSFLGTTRLLNDGAGCYLGSAIAAGKSQDSFWKAAIDHGFRVARAARRVGYSGPLGIDCMVYQDSAGAFRLRLSHDLNGRLTMGRVALALTSLLQKTECGVWCHFPADFRFPDGFPFREKLPQSVRLIRTSPLTIGSRPVATMTALLVSANPYDLQSAFELIAIQANQSVSRTN